MSGSGAGYPLLVSDTNVDGEMSFDEYKLVAAYMMAIEGQDFTCKPKLSTHATYTSQEFDLMI